MPGERIFPDGMDTLPAATSTRASLSREHRSVLRGDPSDFLDLFSGECRGFWGLGDHWIAWAGAARVIEFQGGGGGHERFRALRDGCLGLQWTGTAPRFFGGLSFLEGEQGDPVWAGYPEARFVLPRFILERSAEGLVLSAWHERDGAGGSVGSRLDEVTRELEARGDVGEAAPTGDPFPAGRLWEGHGPAQDHQGRQHWDEAVVGTLAAIGRGELEKAVLARTLDVTLTDPVDPAVLLRHLRAENPRAHVFLLEPRPGTTFFGAAPELLVAFRDGDFEATAVAGSISRGRDEEEDRTLAGLLLASEKDRREHDLTVREIVEDLEDRLEELVVDPEPRVLTLTRIQHLETRIHGRAREGEDVLSLLQVLHPTPAVCGRPRARALELIRAAEPFGRGWYAGPVGWFDGDGNGEFVPALRSAVGGGASWRLFAGAGIVPGSNPESEWSETALKFEPALRVLQGGAGRPG
jgi:menaquinone-specific isochorismate synthase